MKARDKNIKNEGNLHKLSPFIVFTNNLPIKYLVASFKLKKIKFFKNKKISHIYVENRCMNNFQEIFGIMKYYSK